ncbi:MAG: amidohydrolase family protein, partial [Chloroflexi bacterium]|nr:amidohydrolase family protein [Chloroflexota bacterium]
HLWSLGLTGVHDYDSRRCFVALQMLHQAGELRLRVVKGIPLGDLPHAVAVGLRSGFGDDFLRIGAVKLFSDGALGPHSAAMLQPYENEVDNLGMLFLDSAQILAHGQQAVHNGFNLAIHAIGDRANREVLHAYARLRDYERLHGLPALRHRIEHVQVLAPEDLPLLARYGIVASVQPIHATSDMYAADQFWGTRARYAYAYRQLSQLGTVMAFGSDAPVESPNPFWGIHAVVNRRRQNGEPGPQGWYGEQRLSLEQALAGYTLGPAYAAGQERRFGRLAPGYAADLIVLNTDPFTLPPEALFQLHVDATMIAGEWVWQS